MSASNIGLVTKSQSAALQPTIGKGEKPATSRLQVRRFSYGFRDVPGVRPIEGRSSQVGLDFKRPLPTYLPTYQLNPSSRFNSFVVTKMIEWVLDENFTGIKYDSQESPNLALRLAFEIMKRAKHMNFNRYRIISIVTIGQKRAQSYNNAVTFLWDHERDDYADVHKELTTCFIQVTVFGIYLD